MSDIEIEVERTFKVSLGGSRFVCSESDLKDFLGKPEIWPLIESMIHERQGNTPASQDMTIDQLMKSHVKLPKGWRELDRRPTDPKAAYKSVFVYAVNDEKREYGYRIIDAKGRLSSFTNLGSPLDTHTSLGALLENFPETDKPMIKGDLFKLPHPGITEGRRMKAAIDLLEILGHLEKKPLPSRNGRFGYTRTSKTMGLEGVRKHEPVKAKLPSNP